LCFVDLALWLRVVGHDHDGHGERHLLFGMKGIFKYIFGLVIYKNV